MAVPFALYLLCHVVHIFVATLHLRFNTHLFSSITLDVCMLTNLNHNIHELDKKNVAVLFK